MGAEMKIAFERLIGRLEMSERRTNAINFKSTEMSQTEMQKKQMKEKKHNVQEL